MIINNWWLFRSILGVGRFIRVGTFPLLQVDKGKERERDQTLAMGILGHTVIVLYVTPTFFFFLFFFFLDRVGGDFCCCCC